MMLAVVGALLARRARAVRVRERARRQGPPSARGGSRGRQRRAGDARPVPAAVRAAVPRAGRAEPAPPRARPRTCALARAAAVRGGARGTACACVPSDVSFPGGGFAPTRVTVRVRGSSARPGRTASAACRRPGRASATAELSPDAGVRDCRPTRAAAAMTARSRTARASRCAPTSRSRSTAWRRRRARRPGSSCSITSGFRSDAEQAVLFAAHPDPKWVAPPGESLHRYATELDLGPPAAYGVAGARTRRGSASCSATRGSRGTSATRATRAARRSASARAAATAAPPAPSSRSCPPASRR